MRQVENNIVDRTQEKDLQRNIKRLCRDIDNLLRSRNLWYRHKGKVNRLQTLTVWRPNSGSSWGWFAEDGDYRPSDDKRVLEIQFDTSKVFLYDEAYRSLVESISPILIELKKYRWWAD